MMLNKRNKGLFIVYSKRAFFLFSPQYLDRCSFIASSKQYF